MFTPIPDEVVSSEDEEEHHRSESEEDELDEDSREADADGDSDVVVSGTGGMYAMISSRLTDASAQAKWLKGEGQER